MGRNRGRTRRQFGALAGLVVAGIAGCLGDGDSSDPDDSSGTDDGGSDSGSDDTTEDGGQSDDTTNDDSQSDDTTNDDSQSDDTTGDDPEAEAKAVVEEFYSRAEMVESEDDVDDYIDAISELVHSVSPLPEFYRSLAESDEGDLTVTVYGSVETTVVGEDLGSGEIQDNFFLAREVPEEDLEAVAGENLVVEAALSDGTSVLGGSDTGDGDQEDTTRWLVAPDDGDWLIVF